MKPPLHLIGVPFDLCGRLPGSRLGPTALRLARLTTNLRDLGLEVYDRGDLLTPDALPVPVPRPYAPTSIPCFEEAIGLLPQLEEMVSDVLREGALPVVLGGDHSLSIGSIAAGLRHYGDDLAVLWVDAHADLNTPATSPSLNLHGMSLAALLGREAALPDPLDVQWAAIRWLVGRTLLRPSRTAWIGLREVDPGERDAIREMPGCLPITMHDVDRQGIARCAVRFDQWMRRSGARQLWISFDVDAMDPVLAPGTGTAVHGGLTYREAHLLAELLREQMDRDDCGYRLVGLDVVETNPTRDTRNETASMATEWVASLFGKTILG